MTLYEILNIQPVASTEQIRASFRELSKQHHPDKNGGERTEMWDKLNQAHQVLTDANSRGIYDQTGLVADSPDDKPLIAAIGLIRELMIDGVTSNPEHNVLAYIQQQLTSRKAKADQQIGELAQAIGRWRKSIANIEKRWSGGERVKKALLMTLAGCIEQGEQAKMPLLKQIELYDLATAQLKDSSYEMPVAAFSAPSTSWIINLR